MSSKVTAEDFQALLIAPVGSVVNGVIKIEDNEKAVFAGTFKRTISWQEENRFFTHKTMVQGTHGQKEAPQFNASSVKEVFPVEITTVVFLTDEEIQLKNFYDTNSLSA